MVDDFRRPLSTDKKEEDDQNKYQQEEVSSKTTTPPLEAPHLYEQEDGFASAKPIGNKDGKLSFIQFLKNTSPKERVLGGALVAVLIIGGGSGVYAFNRSNQKQPIQPVVANTAPAPQSTTEASRLTGVEVNPQLNKRPVTGVMIENSPDARPQAGLKDAGIVFEAIAEGGITRFLTLFQESQPDYIGPVRSVRPYYVDLLLPFDASLAHAGGSADGLARVRALGVKDLDHGANGDAFRRVSDRFAPHNLYTSTADLDKASAGRGYTTSNFKSFLRKKEQPNQPVTARTIDLTLSSPLYNVHYDFDPASNTYKRSEGGKPHTDHRSGQQLTPKTVVALAMQYSQNGIYSVYQTQGSGKMYVFQDGVVTQGTWSKANEREQFVFTDDAGKPLALNAGQTWFTLVKAPDAVKYGP